MNHIIFYSFSYKKITQNTSNCSRTPWSQRAHDWNGQPKGQTRGKGLQLIANTFLISPKIIGQKLFTIFFQTWVTFLFLWNIKRNPTTIFGWTIHLKLTLLRSSSHIQTIKSLHSFNPETGGSFFCPWPLELPFAKCYSPRRCPELQILFASSGLPWLL